MDFAIRRSRRRSDQVQLQRTHCTSSMMSMQAACRHAKQSCNNTYIGRHSWRRCGLIPIIRPFFLYQHTAPENGWDLINNQYEIIWFEGLQLPDTLVPDREDFQCEDDDSPVVQSSDDENGELSSENDDDDY